MMAWRRRLASLGGGGDSLQVTAGPLDMMLNVMLNVTLTL